MRLAGLLLLLLGPDGSTREGGGFSRANWLAAERLRVNTGFGHEHDSVSGDVAVPEFGCIVPFE